MKQISLILLLAILAGCYSAEPEKTGLEGKAMPSFKILLPDSTTYVDTKDIKTGKPVVIFYYSPHCPYSRAQMEEMIEEKDKLENVQLYLVTPVSFAEMKEFYNHYQLNKYPNIIAGCDYENFVGNYFKVLGYPYTAIYNNEKKLNKAFVGKIYTKQIKSSLD